MVNKGGEKNMENDQRPTLEQILGRQAMDLLSRSGIRNLRVEADGSISGEITSVNGLPQIDSISNLTIRVEGNRIVIEGKISGSTTDVGKII